MLPNIDEILSFEWPCAVDEAIYTRSAKRGYPAPKQRGRLYTTVDTTEGYCSKQCYRKLVSINDLARYRRTLSTNV